MGVIEAFSLANCPISRVMIIRMVRKEFKLGDKWRGDDGTWASSAGTACSYTSAWLVRSSSFLDGHTFSPENDLHLPRAGRRRARVWSNKMYLPE